MEGNVKKSILLSLGFVMILFLIIGTGTYAWFKWSSTASENVNVQLTADTVITFNGGTAITGNFMPVLNKEDGIIKTISITSATAGNTFSLYMNIDLLPEEFKSTSVLWAIYKDNVYINGDTFENYETGDTDIVLFEDAVVPSSSTDVYTIYYWIDGSVINSADMMNKKVKLTLYATGSNGAINEL